MDAVSHAHSPHPHPPPQLLPGQVHVEFDSPTCSLFVSTDRRDAGVDAAAYRVKERPARPTRRQIRLPVNVVRVREWGGGRARGVDAGLTAPPPPQLGDKISSKIVHGVLEVTVPYAPEGVTRRQIAVTPA